MKLDALAGNAHLKAQLSAQADGRGLAHAYLIAGPAGSGKRTLARLMAAAMVCSAQGETPCGVCPGCKKALSGIHPDIAWVGSDGKDISVGQVRELRLGAYVRPNEAPRRVFVLENAHNMNQGAQNALLKLLEDGPSYAAFLLLTGNAGSVLATIRSRCQTLSLSPLTPAQTEDYLRQRVPQAAPDALYTAVRRCGGILGPAVAQLSGEAEGGSAARQGALELVEHIAQGDELALAQWCAGQEKSDRDGFAQMLIQAVELLRDALAAASGADVLSDGNRERSVIRAAAALPRPQLLRVVALLEKLMEDAAFNVGTGHLCGALAAGIMEVRQ